MSYTAEHLINIALAEEGYLEKKSNSQLDDKTANAGTNNWTKYARDLKNAGYYNNKNKNGYAWCDVFVDWCHYKAAGNDAVEAQRVSCQSGPYGAGATWSMKYYKEAGQWSTSPLPGDQIFYGNKSSPNKSTHTGIVYKVDNKKVYTIEGNTSLNTGVDPEGTVVAKRSHSLTYKKILGYGRPRYIDSTGNSVINDSVIVDDNSTSSNTKDNVEQLIPETVIVQSITNHNFFDIKLISISSNNATAKVSLNDTKNYDWSYEVINLTNNTSKIVKIASANLDNFVIANLSASTPYVLKLSAESNSLKSSQQILFITLQDTPDSVSNLKFKLIESSNNNIFNIKFDSPKTWGTSSSHKAAGYRVSLLVDGNIISFSDNLITDISKAKIDKNIGLADFENISHNIQQYYFHNIQLGVQTWIKDYNNRIFLNNFGPVCSQPVYMSTNTIPVNKLYLKTAGKFKQAVLQHIKQL